MPTIDIKVLKKISEKSVMYLTKHQKKIKTVYLLK